MKKLLLVFGVSFFAIEQVALAVVPNLECEPLNKSFNDCHEHEYLKSELVLTISDSVKYPEYKEVTFKYDIEAKPMCYTRQVKGSIVGLAYFETGKVKSFIFFSPEEQERFASVTSFGFGETWESVTLTGRKSQQYIEIDVLNESSAEVELRSYEGIHLNNDHDVVPLEEIRLRRKLNCKIVN